MAKTTRPNQEIAKSRTRVRRGSTEEAEALKQRFVAAALKLFATGGLAAVTMRAIATEVGGSAMGPYWYFEDKTALLRAMSLHFLTDAVDAMQRAVKDSHDVRERIRLGTSAFVDYWERNPEHYELAYCSDSVRKDDGLATSASPEYVANVLAEAREASRELAKSIGADVERAKLAADLQFVLISGYLHSRLVNHRYPWSSEDALRQALIDAVVPMMERCLCERDS